MPVAAEIASMLDALDAPAMLIRPDDMTVAAVNDAFAQAYGRFRFEGKRCWEALHRAGPCPKSGLPCPLAQTDKVGVSCVEQTLFSSARVTELAVTMRPVRSADGKTLYWLETLRSKTDDAEPFRRGTVGVSRAHAEVMHALERLAAEDVPYLIVGEAGVGKELYARTVHENSARASRPFVVVAGSCLTGTAAQTLLCGTENAAGLLERADGGTTNADRFRWAAVFQEDRLLEQLDAAGNLRFALGAAYDEAAASTLLAELGLGDVGDKRVRDWSGGMKRRLALARALLAPSDALALAEPFTGLDADNRAAAQRCVARAAREKIVLLVSHEDDALTGAEVRLQ